MFPPETAAPVWKIGASDFFFAYSKDRPDLLMYADKRVRKETLKDW